MQSILHIDMDAFFAAVEVIDNPSYAGKPLVVGSPPDKRGVVSTASYEARKFGVHSAMPSRTAYKLCPHAIFVPVRMSRYLDASEKIMDIINNYSPMIEQISVDEAFVDVAGVLRRWDSPEALAHSLKNAIKEATGLTSSIGLAHNKFLAKLASDYKKPDGLTIVPDRQEDVLEFLAPLPVNRIWGVGKVTERALHASGFRTIRDLQNVSAEVLVPVLGPALANHISMLARGEDSRDVETESETKSISAEHTFGHDIADRGVVRRVLVGMVEQVGRRLRRLDTSAKTIFIKIRYDDFQTVNRQETVEEAVCSDRKLLKSAVSLMEKEPVSRPVRLIGFGVRALTDEERDIAQMELFANSDREKNERDDNLDRAVDAIKEKLGDSSIQRASGMDG